MTSERLRLRDVLKIGDRVQHHGTKCWGTIREIVPRYDGGAELRIVYAPTEASQLFVGETWWATYHLGAFAIFADDPRRDMLASFGRLYSRDEETIYDECITGRRRIVTSWKD